MAMDDNGEPLIKSQAISSKYQCSVSHAYDELHSFRTYLRWMCVDQSSFWMALISWSMFLLFAVIVPATPHFLLACPSCDVKHSRPYDSVLQLSLSRSEA
ncbi:hypothetical protein K1719_032835 [Acacia pycnantha]|nr:hypothetical protein K1719_032835 [Acacia pycnantha]